MNYYLAPNLYDDKHAFFGRQGGVSTGKYRSLNFNYKSCDERENIIQNMEIIANYYNCPVRNIVRLLQAHTNNAIFIDQPTQYQFKADGVVTNNRNLVLSITSADCVPVLFADYKHGIIGAAHAGWRGVLYGVLENTIEVMLTHGARINNISVATGPCLQKQSFEVRNDMRSLFIEYDPDLTEFFEPRDDHDEHFLCNLEGIIQFKLEKMGIIDISLSGIDTYTHPDHYFSYRREVHQGQVQTPDDFPIQLSTICL